MLNRRLLLCPLVLLLFNCSDNDSNDKPNTGSSDNCLLTNIRLDSSFYESIIYDTVSFMPIRIIKNGKVEQHGSYTGNQYTVTTFHRSETDTASIIRFNLDSDRKVTSYSINFTDVALNRSLFNRECEYNPDNTIKVILTNIYRIKANEPQTLIGSTEQRFGWTNGNLTTDSNFTILNAGTPQETKQLSRVTRWEFSNEPDVKGLAGLFYDVYRVPNLFGKGPRNLVSKIIEDPNLNPNNLTEITYVTNEKGWPTIVKNSFGQFKREQSYTYTCYRR